jgi:hypothetical protein
MVRRKISLVLCLALSIGFCRAAEVPEPLVPRAKRDVQPSIQEHLQDVEGQIGGTFARVSRYPAQFRSPIRHQIFKDPWAGMTKLEDLGLTFARAGHRGRAGLADLLVTATSAIGKPTTPLENPPEPPPEGLGPVLDYLAATLQRAHDLRNQAVQGVNADEHEFMTRWPLQQVRTFHCQMRLSKQVQQLLQNDRGFGDRALLQTDWTKLNHAALTLLTLVHPEVLEGLRETFRQLDPLPDVEGVTGKVLVKSKTPSGLILVGGDGPNTYDLKQPVALIIDLGGDDTYNGTVAATTDKDHPLGMVIDLAGNDTYQPGPFGLAAGRFGVGILADLAGDDTYTLPPGSGGVGFAGIGLLFDAAGDDVYNGTRFTLGAGFCGVGLLCDAGGNDRYDSHAFSLGLGAPGGIGVVLDTAGDDSYRCGFNVPSGYNAENKGVTPKDPKFQYDAFGLGMGVGRRLYPPSKNGFQLELSGGIGMVLELAGNDTYWGSNFAFGAGYFLGVGAVMDLAGNDRYNSARYAHGSGAHLGAGLFLDYAGADVYTSTGPTWTGGSAWDHSQCLFVDAAGNDDYQWKRTAGLGIAQGESWAVFAELAGDDTYAVRQGPAHPTPPCLVVFFDGGGKDDYRNVGNKQAINGKTQANGKKGSLFVDRGQPSAD